MATVGFKGLREMLNCW